MTEIIYLNYINELKSRIDAKTTLIQVILGPRQVGKTTTTLKLIEHHYRDLAVYVSADSEFNTDANWLTKQWLKAQSAKKILFIDEIQKCHGWSQTIKSLYDDSKKKNNLIHCVLLGSSSLEIQSGLTESLTGRFQLIKAYHWNYLESKAGYNISFDDYLKFGGYPGSYHLISSKSWADYVKNSIIMTVVEKDILLNQKVKNPALFKQAFEILMSYPAQEISYTKLLGQLQDRGNIDLVKYYINLYEGAFLLKSLEKYSNKAVLRKGSSPKILPLAPCLTYLQILSEYTSDELGRTFELIVGAQLVRTGAELYYWREGRFEVDYVLKNGRKLFAIEVKSGRARSTKGLAEFKQRHPQARLIIIDRENYFEFEMDPLGYLEKNSV